MDEIKKFLLKLTKKERTILQRLMEDVRILNLKNYDVKPLKGYKNLFRLRKGNFRIVFCKGEESGMVVDLDYRKDVYRK
ncbi:hypothetical protein AUJ78_01820 [Candidatus Peregrinibacteria bacterium CG1_02_41_10]|nr:MAG: hypothetical protein AUJ78_01820 [Candidatus Peregrinibacteria bacterium CG1_02_41_10]